MILFRINRILLFCMFLPAWWTILDFDQILPIWHLGFILFGMTLRHIVFDFYLLFVCLKSNVYAYFYS